MRLVYVFLGIIILLSGAIYFHAGRKIILKNAEAKKIENKIGKEISNIDNILKSDVASLDQNNTGSDTNADSVFNTGTGDIKDSSSQYPLHQNISCTFFWAGEEAGDDNKNISNLPSAWDEDWVKHFGGVDKPNRRNGFMPAKFTPKENPFYFALPYNDFDKKGNRKPEIFSLADWAKEKKLGTGESYCKNQWIKIIKGSKVAYAQWEDVGPFKEDDTSYVFGSASPKSKTNKNAGLDVSPAVKDYLALADIDKVSWQFVDESLVPDGPWKKIVTKSQIYWK